MKRVRERFTLPRARRTVSAAVTVALAAASAGASPQSVTITSSKDNTLIQTSDGSMSNGAAEAFYAGRVGPIAGSTIRRGVIAFDIAEAVPAGSTITEVSLTLFMAATQSGNQTIHLRRMLADWGEGTSNFEGGLGAPSTPGDATWLHRFWPDVFWSNVGGDFTSVSSASAVVGPVDLYTWQSTTQLVADVQDWLDRPETNFGWLVQGNEATSKTVKKFGSRHAPPHLQPALSITYLPPQCAPADLNCDGSVGVPDLLMLLSQWGECAECEDCPADLTGSCTVGVADLLILLANWG